jgi:hypothetical protein
MSVAPHAGVVDFGTFTPPTLSLDGIQGEVPQPLIGQENYVLTGNGWSSLAALGALTYQGTWDASTNTPTLVSSVGVQGYYYVVSVAGSTNLNGITTWDVGDWAIFNGSAWQKIEGGSAGTFQTLTVTGQAALNTISGSTSIADTSTVGQFGVKLAPSFGAGSNWDSKVALFGNVNLASGAGSGAFGVSFDTTQGSSLMSIAPALAWYNMKYLANTHQFFGFGFEQFRVAPTNSAVNYVQVTGATTSNRPRISFEGSDGNIGGLYVAKGSGGHSFCSDSNASVVQFAISRIASAVNYIQAQGSTTGNQPFLWVGGTDTNIALGLSSKGDGNVNIFTNGGGNAQLQVSHTASAVNYVRVTGAATGGSPTISAQGSDTDINITLTSKGAGAVRFQTAGTIRATVDSGGATNLGISASGGVALKVPATGSQVNFFQMVGAATTTTPVISTLGSDTNVALAIQSKGTGAIDLAAGSSGVNISNGGTVTALTRTNVGAGYTSVPTIAISPPTTAGGTTATATVTSMGINLVTIVSGGTGYAVNDEILISGGTFTTQARYRITAVSAGVVTTLTPITTPNYQALPTNPASTTTAIGTGSGLTLTVNWAVTGQSFTAGSGYIEQPTVTFSGGGGSGAAAYATVGTTTVVRSLGATMQFNTPGGTQFAVSDSASTSAAYWQAVGGNATADLRTAGAGVIAGVISTQTAVPILFRTAFLEQFRVAHTASAVNYFQVQGSATGNATGPIMSMQGSDANISTQIQGKGTGSVAVLTPTSLGGTVGNTSELFAAKGFNTNQAILRASQFRHSTGTDWTTASLRLGQRIDATDMSFIEYNPVGFAQGIAIQAANNQPINFRTNGEQFRVAPTTTAVNYQVMSGSAANNSVQYYSAGSDTNISMAIQPKGTGAINLAAGTRGINVSNGGTVTNITRTNQGSGYTTITGLTWTASAPTTTGGSTATGTVTSLGGVSATIAGGGTGYTAGNVLTVVGGTFSSASTITVNTVSGGVITGATLTNGGTYTVIPANPVSVTGGSGTGATFNITYGILGLSITTAGSGYVEEPTVSFSGGGGSGAVAYATVGSNTFQKTLSNIHTFSTPNSDVLAIVDKNSSGNYPVNTTVAFSMIPNQNGFGANFLGSSAPLYFATASTSTTEAFTFATSVGTPVSNGGGGPSQFRIVHTTSAVNYVQVTGSATGAASSALGGLSFTGSDASPNFAIGTKGTGYIAFYGQAATNVQSFRISNTNASSAGNLLQVQGAAAGSAPSISAISGTSGTDANVSINLVPKGTGTVQQNGNPLAQVNHKYHAFTVGSYYYDTYEQNNYFRLFTQNAAADTIRYGAVNTPEYYDYGTSTWTAWAAGLTGIQNLLDGNPQTGMSVAHANRTFRFVVTNSDGWPTNALVMLQTTWAAITYTTATVTIASGTSVGGPFTTRQVMVFSPANTGNNWGMHAYYTNSIHTGEGFYQITVDITDWVDSGTYVTYPLINLSIYSNYSTVAGRMVPYSNVYDKTSVFIGGIRTATDANGVLDIGRYSSADPTSYIDSGSNASRIILRTQYAAQVRISHTASAVNYLEFSGGSTGNGVTMAAQGSDTNINSFITSKGASSIVMQTNSRENFRVADGGTSVVNNIQVTGSAAGFGPVIQARGTDTNIDINLTPKGTGRVKYGTHTATADVPITGYIEIVDSGGTIRKLAVIT